MRGTCTEVVLQNHSVLLLVFSPSSRTHFSAALWSFLLLVMGPKFWKYARSNTLSATANWPPCVGMVTQETVSQLHDDSSSGSFGSAAWKGVKSILPGFTPLENGKQYHSFTFITPSATIAWILFDLIFFRVVFFHILSEFDIETFSNIMCSSQNLLTIVLFHFFSL